MKQRAARARVSAESQAIRRTVERYGAGGRGDRIYVDLKLRSDPVVAGLAALGALGRVLDAGAGRGQLGLYLWELGHVSELSGFDPDARKLELARVAAGGDGRYELNDLGGYAAAPGSFDSVLLVDVLHYLAVVEQDAALLRVKAWLRPGGRVLIREVGQRSRLGGVITRFAERLATATGYNRASRPLGFRPLRELVEGLQALGFECDVDDASAGTPFDNALIVARLAAPARSSLKL